MVPLTHRRRVHRVPDSPAHIVRRPPMPQRAPSRVISIKKRLLRPVRPTPAPRPRQHRLLRISRRIERPHLHRTDARAIQRSGHRQRADEVIRRSVEGHRIHRPREIVLIDGGHLRPVRTVRRAIEPRPGESAAERASIRPGGDSACAESGRIEIHDEIRASWEQRGGEAGEQGEDTDFHGGVVTGLDGGIGGQTSARISHKWHILHSCATKEWAGRADLHRKVA